MNQAGKGIKLRIGTRGSPLALAQTAMVRQCLFTACGIPSSDIEIQVIKTTGDQIQNRPLAEVGGKGLFTKEIEVALSAGEIDLAVHSAKDMPTALPEGLLITAFLEREDVRDVLICRNVGSLKEIPRGARLGTASLRREAQVLRLRPDLDVRSLRGNVHTRLRKVEDGEFDATILGMAGLKRLGLTDAVTQVLSVEDFLPAVGQGAIAIEARENDEKTRALLDAINHAPTQISVTAERAFLTVMEGSCRTPIAGHATVSGNAIEFRGMIFRPNGELYETRRTGSAADAAMIGADAGAELKSLSTAAPMAQAG